MFCNKHADNTDKNSYNNCNFANVHIKVHVDHTFFIKIYLEDTDALGIVYYANYLKYLERARTEYLTTLGIDHAMMISKSGDMFVVKTAHLDYLKPARLSDTLIVRTSITEIGTVRLKIKQNIEKDGIILIKASIELVLIDKNYKPKRINKELFNLQPR